ncbi:ABC transporter ATP-binding protein [Anaerostipes sp. 494a]|uniref:murein hydrolase activator EnvC family protein n=1 Tax=unclassified Anaerostipes TaxID=2635253 RepID=UPI00095299DA|nr:MULTISPECIES: M23 family metallopeptidase [unclassified Anaerostipes]MCI5622217.1 peptidoglycan DD-metalloendopeptidase family protein [Anaerostipes sp.]MDY2725648.1 peptidoglycan DD-metalloendopeptidase family protein [Anaerostipes faecalis]OLR59986.1 ABC transporter ATP-binding protein [Anaerostipes sp. 494a]
MPERCIWKKVLIFAAALFLMTGSYHQVIDAKTSKKQIKEENQKLDKLNQQMQAEIEQLDKKMVKSDIKYEKYSQRLETLQKKVQKTERKLKEARESRVNQYKIMDKRIKFLYENGNTAYLEIIFEAKSFQEFLTRAEYISKISQYDSTMFQKLKNTEKKIELSSKQLKKEYKNVQTVTIQAKKEKEQLNKMALAKKQKLAQYRKKLAANKVLLAQYEVEEKRQQETAGAKNEISSGNGASSGSGYSSAGTSFSGNSSSGGQSSMVGSGNLIWPVPSCHSISSGYGYRIHPVTGERKLHAGIDIPCSTGSTIVASDSGTVIAAGYNAYNGNYIKISHGNGIATMYLHCSRLLVSSGSHVSKGQIIAKSGATGMVSGAHLHFVVQKNGNYVNPVNYL